MNIMHKEIISKPKNEYRYKYFKDFQNTLITVSGGTVVASMAYASNLSVKHAVYFAYIGLGALGISILIHIVLLFLSYLGSGYLWDHLTLFEFGPNELADDANKSLKVVGDIIALLTSISLILTPVGFVSLFVFVVKNL